MRLGLLLGWMVLGFMLAGSDARAQDSEGPQAQAGPAEPPATKQEEQAPPSFASGADVTLAITVVAPEHWLLNELTPLRIQFDEAMLEEAPFTLEQAIWDFELEQYLPEFTAEIPLKLAGNLPDGPLAIPVQVLVLICDEKGVMCTLSDEEIKLSIEVLGLAPPDASNQALGKGTNPVRHKLAPPEL